MYFLPLFQHLLFTHSHDLENTHPQVQIYLLHIPANKKTKSSAMLYFSNHNNVQC